MAKKKFLEPTNKKTVLELNEFDVARIISCLAMYGDEMIKTIAVVAAAGYDEKAKQLETLMRPEIDAVKDLIIKSEEGAYTSASFEPASIQVQRDKFDTMQQEILFVMTDGKQGQAPTREGNVVSFPVFKRKEVLH